MRRSGFLLAAAAVAALALTPAVADARAGGGSSSGSRGSRTYSAPPATNTAPGGAQQMQRTATPAAASPATAGAAAQPARGGFMGGMMGGLLAGGLIGAMFGGSLFGGGMAGLLGVLMQIALIGGVVWLAMRLFRAFRRPQLATAGGPAMFTAPGAQDMGTAPLHRAGGGGGAPSGPPVQITPADFKAFEQNLKDVQAAYSTQSLPEMQRLATMEMLTYFETEFSQQASRGLRNTISDVKLLQGDLAESWSEQGRDYATVAMRFGLIDVTRDATGKVVEGNPTQPTQATELWTFVRTQGGNWMLSGIQQTQ